MRLLAPVCALMCALMLSTGQAIACGGADAKCEIDNGYYLAAPPPDWDGESPLPVVVYFHGWNGSPAGVFRNRAMVNGVHKRGALFVAPYARTGYWRQIGAGRAETGRDELAYVHALMKDVRERWPVDETRVMASGFSRGASMVWNVACYAGELFTGFVPIAGGFWHSTPAECPAGPVNMRHIHGTKDKVVAYAEVGVYNSMPISEGIDLYLDINRLKGQPVRSFRGEAYTCTRWGIPQKSRVIELCLHQGGHSIPAEWVALGFDWLEKVVQKQN